MPYSNSSNSALTFSNIPPIPTFHFEGFEDSLPDVNNYNNGAIICVRDGYNTRLYARLETQWVYLNTALNTQQDEDVVNGYNESECVTAGFSPVSLDFNPIRVDDNLNIVRNDAHFKELLDNTLKDLGVINA
jgi:hypothetical protein